MDTLQPSAIAQTVFCGATGLLFLSLLAKVLRIRAAQLFCLEAFVIGYLLRLGILFLNEYYQFFEHKVAGNRSVEFYLNYVAGKGELINLVKDQFALQVVFNVPFFVMFGASLLTVTISNTFLSALTAPLIGLLLHNPFGDRVARRGMMLFFIYPGSVNFALFGLRDPLIFVGMAVFGVAAITVYAGYSARLYALICTLACIWTLALRPEMSYVIVALVGLLILPWLQRVIAPEQRPVEKFALVAFFTVALIVLCMPAAVVSLKIAALQIGSDSINPLDFAGERAEERFARAEVMGMGGGTHYVSAESYAALPIYLRVPLQTVGLIVTPFPWMISGPAQLFAFIDSLLLMGIMALAFRASWSGRRGAPVVWALLLAFCIGILGMGVIVSNAGNGFRMRFGVVPLLLLAGAFCRSIPVMRLRNR